MVVLEMFGFLKRMIKWFIIKSKRCMVILKVKGRYLFFFILSLLIVLLFRNIFIFYGI